MLNKKFPSAEITLGILLIRMAPYLGLGFLMALLGFHFGHLVPPTARATYQIIYLGLLGSLIVLDTEPGWNGVLLACFGLAAGILIHWSSPAGLQARSMILFFLCTTAALAGAGFHQKTAIRAAAWLFPGTLLYLMGWIILKFFSLPARTVGLWIVFGLVLFTLILMSGIVRAKNHPATDRAIPQAIQVFVILVNLYWLMNLLEG
jgi:uncharacterized membrane protein YhdT